MRTAPSTAPLDDGLNLLDVPVHTRDIGRRQPAFAPARPRGAVWAHGGLAAQECAGGVARSQTQGRCDHLGEHTLICSLAVVKPHGTSRQVIDGSDIATRLSRLTLDQQPDLQKTAHVEIQRVRLASHQLRKLGHGARLARLQRIDDLLPDGGQQCPHRSRGLNEMLAEMAGVRLYD